MLFQEALKIVSKDPSFIFNDEYIKARLKANDFEDLQIEMGPNCNLTCPHCADECSQTKKGLPKKSLVKTTLKQSKKAGIMRIHLTDGEPIRHENLGVLEVVTENSGLIPVSIVSNAKFARTPKSALRYFSYLKDNGLDFPGKKDNYLTVSLGCVYRVPQGNYKNLIAAFSNVYPDADPGKSLNFRLIKTGHVQTDLDYVNDLIRNIYSVLGKRRSDRLAVVNGSMAASIYPRKGKPIKINFYNIHPWGRAKNLVSIQGRFPSQVLDPKNLGINSNPNNSLALFYTGDLQFSDSHGIFGRESSYGNIKDKPLVDTVNRIRSDPLYQAYKLGGPGLLYTAAQRLERLVIEGRSSWDVTRRILNDPNLVERLRYFFASSVIEPYKEFVSTVDLTNPRVFYY